MYFENIILTQINIFDKKFSTNSSNQRGKIRILLTSILSSTQFLVLVIKNDGGYRNRPNYNQTTTFCPRNQRMCRSTRYVDLWNERMGVLDQVQKRWGHAQMILYYNLHENVEDMMDFCTERRFLRNCRCCVSQFPLLDKHNARGLHTLWGWLLEKSSNHIYGLYLILNLYM